MRASLPGLALVLLAVASVLATEEGTAAPPQTERVAPSSASSPVIVLGFLGGYLRPDSTLHVEVQLADRLRAEYAPDAYVEVFENHKELEAYARVLQLLDVDHNGSLSDEEKRKARIIVYGHSWGASETVELARQLEQDSIPVLLTIQVDSIVKRKEDDAWIPANVGEAVNFYQGDSFLHGRAQILAADPQRTKILGNFRFDYKTRPVSCPYDYRWLVRHFAKTHAEIECDPNVWDQVESLIRSKLPPARVAAPVAFAKQPIGN
jgi:hypothetical protein